MSYYSKYLGAKRVGYVFCTEEMAKQALTVGHDAQDALRLLYQRVMPLEVYLEPTTLCFRILAASYGTEFDEVNDGDVIPYYKVTFDKTSILTGSPLSIKFTRQP